MTRLCLGCMKDIKDNNFVKCIACKQFCHQLCVTTAGKKLPKDSNWTCPNCISKKPKGDNTNTPIRHAEYDSQSSPSWITQRSQTKGKISPCLSDNETVCRCLSKEDIRDILRNEIRRVLSVEVADLIKNAITPQLREINTDISALKSEITTVRESMDFINSKYEDIKSEMNNKFELTTRLQREVTELRGANKELNRRLTDMEQHTRATNIELQCVPEHSSENLLTLTQQLAKTVKFDLNANDIHMCARVAKTNSSSSRPRSIVVKLRSPLIRDGLLAAVIKFNRTNPSEKLNSAHLGIGGDKKPVFVAEHLSPHNKELHKAARLKAKESKYKFVWVRNGRIFVRKNESSPAIIVKDLQSVNNIT